jgi:hypothetical protein
MLVFSTPLVNLRSFNLLTGSSPHPLPCENKYRVCIYTVCNGGGGSGCVESIHRSYTLCIWPDSEPTKSLYHPKQKLRRRGGLRQKNTCRQVPLQVDFLKKLTSRISFLVHGVSRCWSTVAKAMVQIFPAEAAALLVSRNRGLALASCISNEKFSSRSVASTSNNIQRELYTTNSGFV